MREQPIGIERGQSSVLASNAVLRNTYMLLGLTLAFSALMAGISIMFNLPRPHWLIFLVGAYGLMFLVEKNRNSGAGLALIFAFTGFMGYCLGPILNYFISSGAGDIVTTAFGGTAMIFLALSAFALVTKRDLSFLGGMLFAGFWVLIALMLANAFLALPLLSLVISALFILFSAGAILLTTQSIIRGGETNYISATLTLYLSIYNIFVSLLQILGIMGDD